MSFLFEIKTLVQNAGLGGTARLMLIQTLTLILISSNNHTDPNPNPDRVPQSCALSRAQSSMRATWIQLRRPWCVAEWRRNNWSSRTARRRLNTSRRATAWKRSRVNGRNRTAARQRRSTPTSGVTRPTSGQRRRRHVEARAEVARVSRRVAFIRGRRDDSQRATSTEL